MLCKGVKKNLAQHRVGERSLSIKLEIYEKFFLDFFCGSPTSIETSGQDEEDETRLSGIAQEEEM